MITQRIKMIFSAYRRDDFADADGFMLQLGMVLERYSDEVIRIVSDPRTGVQRRHKFPPSIAEVVEACEAEATSIATRARLEAIPRPRPRALLEGPRERPQGCCANLLVPASHPRYAAMVERSRGTAQIYWRTDPRGIWVPFTWLDDAEGSRQTWRPLSAAELLAMYAAPASPPAGEAAE